jgi:glycerol dehydrogenase-like iron-containing ADH family enzyme
LAHYDATCDIIIGVGSGVINDISKILANVANRTYIIVATAAYMDGYAAGSSSMALNGVKVTVKAKAPEIIVGDLDVLCGAPVHMAKAGLGDMLAKYVSIAEWRIANEIIGEYYCERIAALTREGVDTLMGMADRVKIEDEETAGKIFESLLKTGLGMSFAKNSRPASGAEHVIAHLIECFELMEGKEPNFHGEDVGVCTLAMLKYYNGMKARAGDDPYNEWWIPYEFLDELINRIHWSKEHEIILWRKIDRVPNEDIVKELSELGHKAYSVNYISTIWKQHLSKRIVKEAYLWWEEHTHQPNGLLRNMTKWKICDTCGEQLYADEINFGKYQDGTWKETCKHCAYKKKLEKRG